MSTLRRTAATATDLACRATGLCGLSHGQPPSPVRRDNQHYRGIYKVSQPASKGQAQQRSSSTRQGAVPSATACTIMPRTAASTALIRRAERTTGVPGPASTAAPASASAPDTTRPACASQVTNGPSCPAPASQLRPDRAHQRRNSATPPAYAFVVDSAPSRPNRPPQERARSRRAARGTGHRHQDRAARSRTADARHPGRAASLRTHRPHPGRRIPGHRSPRYLHRKGPQNSG